MSNEAPKKEGLLRARYHNLTMFRQTVVVVPPLLAPLSGLTPARIEGRRGDSHVARPPGSRPGPAFTVYAPISSCHPSPKGTSYHYRVDDDPNSKRNDRLTRTTS